MTPSDRVLLVTIAAAILLMAFLVLAPQGPGGGGAAGGSLLPGEPRAVDVDLLRRRLVEGSLSDHEALYWHPEPR